MTRGLCGAGPQGGRVCVCACVCLGVCGEGDGDGEGGSADEVAERVWALALGRVAIQHPGRLSVISRGLVVRLSCAVPFAMLALLLLACVRCL